MWSYNYVFIWDKPKVLPNLLPNWTQEDGIGLIREEERIRGLQETYLMNHGLASTSKVEAW